jgi:hypothetical protein
MLAEACFIKSQSADPGEAEFWALKLCVIRLRSECANERSGRCLIFSFSQELDPEPNNLNRSATRLDTLLVAVAVGKREGVCALWPAQC